MGILGFFRPNVSELEGRKDIPGLIKALGYTGKGDTPLQAIEALGRLGEPAIAALVSCFTSMDCAFRSQAKEALTKIKKPAIKHLVQSLEHVDRTLGKEVLEVLGEIGWQPEEKHHKSCVAFIEEDWLKLASLGDERAVEPLLNLSSPSWMSTSEGREFYKKGSRQ